VRLAPSAGATNQQQNAAQVLHVSGDDMGSGLGWDASPEKRRPSAAQKPKALSSAQQQQQQEQEQQQDAGLEEAGQQGWQEW
jgi:flagellar biosynthesis/type III secretory pathway protein FliH